MTLLLFCLMLFCEQNVKRLLFDHISSINKGSVHQRNRKETQKEHGVRDEARQERDNELPYRGSAGRGRLLPAGSCWLVPVFSIGVNQSRAVPMSPMGEQQASVQAATDCSALSEETSRILKTC